MNGVHACDMPACANAAGALLAAVGGHSIGGVGIRSKAACYELFSGGLVHVPDAACRTLAPWPASFVDFDRRELVCVVDRKQPEL